MFICCVSVLQTAVVSLCLSTAPALNHVINCGSWWSWVSSRMQMLTRLRWWPSCMLRVDVMFGCSGGVLHSVLWCCWLGGRKGIWPVKTEWWGAGVVVCLEWGADLHMAHLMPLPLTVSCFSKTPIGFTFLVPAYPCSPGKRAVKRVCVCVCCSGRVCRYLCVWLKATTRRAKQSWTSSCATTRMNRTGWCHTTTRRRTRSTSHWTNRTTTTRAAGLGSSATTVRWHTTHAAGCSCIPVDSRTTTRAL